MTVSELIESLHVANENVRASLERWQSCRFPAASIRAQDFSTLKNEILRTATCLRNNRASWTQDAELAKQISQYRLSLEQLVRVLPFLQLGLQAHKGRLQAALRHLNGVAAWSDCSRKSL